MLNFLRKKNRTTDMVKRVVNVVTPFSKKSQVIIGELIRKTPAGRHGWYQSNVGPVRKPLQ